MNSKERKQLRFERRQLKRQQKRQNQLPCTSYDEVFTFNNLYKSYIKCRKSVGWKASVQKCKFDAVLEIGKIYNSLKNREYVLEPFFCFDIKERGKLRHIKSLSIKGRIVQRCMCDFYLNPLIEHTLIFDNAACIKGKGLSFAFKRIKKHIRRNIVKGVFENNYLVIFDIHDYFNSIDHEILLNFLQPIILDKELYSLLYRFINAFGNYKSLGLGSQISQACALFYLNKIDHYVKEKLKVKLYQRFMDDGYAFCKDKKEAAEVLNNILYKIHDLELQENPNKTQITNLNNGFNFLKLLYKVKNNQIITRPCYNNVVKAKRKIRYFQRKLRTNDISPESVEQSYMSFRGNLKVKCNCYSILKSTDMYYTTHTGFIPRN